MYESKDEMVSHPGHYQSETGLEEEKRNSEFGKNPLVYAASHRSFEKIRRIEKETIWL